MIFKTVYDYFLSPKLLHTSLHNDLGPGQVDLLGDTSANMSKGKEYGALALLERVCSIFGVTLRCMNYKVK